MASQGSSTPYLKSDIGALRRVLVHSIATTDGFGHRLEEDLPPDAESDVEAATRHQAALMSLLRGQGADVVEVVDALNAAIAETRKSGVFAAWVETAFPRLGADPDKVTADMLLHRDTSLQWRLGEDGSYRHGADDSTSTMWTRDSAFMTPQGLVITHFLSRWRQGENRLMRFLYTYSPILKDYPVLFDATEEGLILEGGDAMVVDERTLFLGVGNRTDPRVAPVLARRLNMDVLTVQTRKKEFLRPYIPGEPQHALQLRILLLHLDTSFTHVAPQHALTVPFLFEEAYSETNPLSRYVRGARAEMMISEEDYEAALEMLKDFGRVRLFQRGTGKEEALGDIKLVDYLKTQNYRLTYVGGPPPAREADQFRHFMSVVYPEHRRQAANVVQAAPGRVIAYAGNPATKAALEADGIRVDTFEARDLWPWHGGPHCLTQPLERV